MSTSLEVRSFRAVFELERRIYRIDNLRLNPGGVPVRGIAYLIVAVGSMALGSDLPLLHLLLAPVPWYVRDLGVPLVVAGLLTVAHVDGRHFHHFVVSLLAHRISAPQLSGLIECPAIGVRWQPPPMAPIDSMSD